MAIILSLYYRVCHIIFPPYYISRVLTVSSYLVYCFLFRSQSVVLHAQLFYVLFHKLCVNHCRLTLYRSHIIYLVNNMSLDVIISEAQTRIHTNMRIFTNTVSHKFCIFVCTKSYDYIRQGNKSVRLLQNG